MSDTLSVATGRFLVPSYHRHRWGDYRIKVIPKSWLRLFPIVPFFWDTPVNLLLMVHRLRRGATKAVTCSWRLQDLYSAELVKTGQLSCVCEQRYTLPLGYLLPHRCYSLSIIITDDEHVSDLLTVASFTVKDRDELYMQVLIGVIVIIAGIGIGLFAKACSL